MPHRLLFSNQAEIPTPTKLAYWTLRPQIWPKDQLAYVLTISFSLATYTTHRNLDTELHWNLEISLSI